MRTILAPIGISLFASLFLLALASCSDDELAGRKLACAEYVKLKVLPEADVSQCNSQEQTFKEAAGKIAARETENIHPILMETVRRMAVSASKVNLTEYPELPRGLPYLSVSLDGVALPPRFYVDIERVTFDPPTDQGDFSHTSWQIEGYRESVPDDSWTLDVTGIDPQDFQQAKDICPLLAYSSNLSGCRARAFVVVGPGAIPEMPRLEAMAIEFVPPTNDQTRQILLEGEMARWASQPKS